VYLRGSLEATSASPAAASISAAKTNSGLALAGSMDAVAVVGVEAEALVMERTEDAAATLGEQAHRSDDRQHNANARLPVLRRPALVLICLVVEDKDADRVELEVVALYLLRASTVAGAYLSPEIASTNCLSLIVLSLVP
jgi:hypothetical protein